MTRDGLRKYTRDKLARMARTRGISGWHGMRKDQLIEALLGIPTRGRSRPVRRSKSASAKSKSARNGARKQTAAGPLVTTRRVDAANASAACRAPRDRFGGTVHGSGRQDRLDLAACGPNWLQARWTVSSETITRATVALQADWHQAIPVLRLFDEGPSDNGESAARMLQETELTGDDDRWYVHVTQPGRRYSVRLGFRCASGRFHLLLRSLPAAMPERADLDRTAPAIRPERTLLAPELTPQRLAQLAAAKIEEDHGRRVPGTFDAEFALSLRAELSVHGCTHPAASVTLGGRPIRLAQDGTFSLSLALSEGRRVIPAVAVSANGTEERTVVLAVETNTKELEPRLCEDSALA